MTPKSITDLKFNEIPTVLDNYYDPKASEIVESYKLHQRRQQHNELLMTM